VVLVTLATLISHDFPLIAPVAVSLALHLWLDVGLLAVRPPPQTTTAHCGIDEHLTDGCVVESVNNVAGMKAYTLDPVGFVQSSVKGRADAPRQGPEGAPDAWLEIEPRFAEALLGMEVGHELIVITWLHEAKRDVLKGHPRSDETRPLTGVFYTRSPARPNPLGLHLVTVREIEGTRVKIGPIEAFDGTPVVDIKSASTRADQ
jgi:tRNA-Thr(GGU) m(6)t(6)A37 methyltransferase TsaA